ncbi:MAG: signal peptidase II [Planctomycetota bacterium]
MTSEHEASQAAPTVDRAAPVSDRTDPVREVSAAPDSRLRRNLALFAVVGALIALDLWSKGAVFAWFQDPEAAADLPRSERGHLRYPIAGQWLGLMLNLNYGAAFGQGAGMPWLLVAGRCLAAVFLTYLIVRTPRGQKVYLASLVLILSGALGNLYDNFFYRPEAGAPGVQPDRPFGPVRDFIDVYFYGWDWHFPTFNIADSCITVGAILLLATGLFGPREAEEASAELA